MAQDPVIRKSIRRLKFQVNPSPRTRRQIDALIANGQLDEALKVLRREYSRQMQRRKQ